jgi:hypothetical protein
MKLEDQVCSLELAQKLKKLGVKQESMFYWVPSAMPNDPPSQNYIWSPYFDQDGQEVCDDDVSAFTVAELGEIMTDAGSGVVSVMGKTACATLVKKEWWVTGGNWIPEKQKYDHLETDEKWADALAKMLIHLIEKGLVKPC